MSAFQFGSVAALPQNLVNLFSFATFSGSSRGSAAEPTPSSSFPDDDDPMDDLKKEKAVEKETELDPFSLDDIHTPGDRSEWAKTPLPSIAKATLRNPGKYSEMEREVMGVLTTMDIFDGARVEYNRQSSNFLVGHTLSMGSSMEPSNYTFMTQYFDKKFVMLGRIGTEGDFHGVVNNPINSWIGLRLTHQRGPREHPDAITSIESDFTGDDHSTCAKLQFHNQSPAFTLSYNQSITPSLALGCEGQLNFGAGLSALSTAFNFTRGSHVITGQLMKQPLGPLSGHVNFLRKVDTRPGSTISYATQLKVSPDPKTNAYKTEWCVGWDYKLQLSSVKGHIDGNGRIAAMLEQRLTPFMTLILAGNADLWNHKYTFGMGLQVILQELTEEQQMMMMAEEKRQREQSAAKQSAAAAAGDDEFKIPEKESVKSMFKM